MRTGYYYSKSTILLFIMMIALLALMMVSTTLMAQASSSSPTAEVIATATTGLDQLLASNKSIHSIIPTTPTTTKNNVNENNSNKQHLPPTTFSKPPTPIVDAPQEHARQMLVTGAGGFIGFHLSNKLASEEHAFWVNYMDKIVNETANNRKKMTTILNAAPRSVIIGLDNFNDYYSTDLKYMRKKHLTKAIAELNQKLIEKRNTILKTQQHNTESVSSNTAEEEEQQQFIKFQIIEGDVCDTTLLNSIFEQYKFTHILHMAAQAGVRYSLKNPQTYIRNNILCQIELLETTVKHQKSNLPIFVYASSSSVYGNIQEFDPSPFHEGMNVNKPTNVYSASKIAQELFAETYNYLYGVPVIGLRFYTVYGTYGRPDMALFTWTDQIVKGKPITLYTAEGKELLRDFTYIDDIVHGIVNSMKYGERVRREEGRAVHDVFNLGNNTPEKVVDLIKYIEKALDKKATINLVKKPPTDMTMTYADITHSQELLNFQPKTKLGEGVQKFVDWYLKYYHFSSNEVTDDVIFTTYFVTKGHPERNEQYGNSCFEPMKEWYESVHKHNLRAVVFFDDANLYTKCEFNKLTSYNVRFELVQLGDRSTNDERFFVYEKFLQNAQKQSTNGLQLLPKRIIMTDLFDIRFNRNPFNFLSSYDECNGDVCETTNKLFIGSEPTSISSSKWAQQKLAQCGITIDELRGTFYYGNTTNAPFDKLAGKQTSLDNMLLNPGIVGGSVESIMNLLSIFNEFMRASPPQANCNTPVFNILMYQHEEFQREVGSQQQSENLSSLLVTGQPLHTVFKEFDETDNFYIKHK